jgi:hypothetical protein
MGDSYPEDGQVETTLSEISGPDERNDRYVAVAAGDTAPPTRSAAFGRGLRRAAERVTSSSIVA